MKKVILFDASNSEFLGNKFTTQDLKAKKLSDLAKESQNRNDEPIFDYIKKKILNEEKDKERERERIKDKKLKKKLKLKALNEEKSGRGAVLAELASPNDEEFEGYDDEDPQGLDNEENEEDDYEDYE